MDGGGRSRREQAIDDPTDGGGRSRREQAIESNVGAIAGCVPFRLTVRTAYPTLGQNNPGRTRARPRIGIAPSPNEKKRGDLFTAP
jgi:hypothetical protein